ncbi:MAG: hypothetical protein HC904_10780 [Blastochloris sp.]|nr:hypothetical protein [Blastochloris sp.]
MILSEVFRDIPLLERGGDFTVPIRGLRYRSSEVEPGDLFCAWQGVRSDGHEYIPDALRRGAAALLMEKNFPVPGQLAWARVDCARRGLALAAANFYGRPAQALDMIGITGTNGKTSTAMLIHYLLERAGVVAGLLGTIEYRVGSERMEAARTTPESLELQQMLGGDAGQEMPGGGDGGFFPCAEPGASGGDSFQGGGVHQSDSGPPGFSWQHGELLFGQGKTFCLAWKRARRR